jgi:predicted O-methyltransferase YrrM
MKRKIYSKVLIRAREVEKCLQRKYFAATFQELGAKDAERIVSWTTGNELRALYMLAASCPRGGTAVEIGSYLGASTCYIAAGLRHRSGRLFCVDTWENQTMPEGERDTYALFRQNTAPFADLITTVRKRSETLNKADLALPIHLAFIDGDHSYEAAVADFERVADWMAPGGIIAFHDVGVIDFPGVSRVVGGAIASGDWVPAGVTETLTWLRKAKSTVGNASDGSCNG